MSTQPPTPPGDDADYPRSYDDNWSYHLPATPENNAIAVLKEIWETSPHQMPKYEGYKTKKQFLTADLKDFEIYTSPHQKNGWGLSSLESLDIRGKQLWFDGVLSIGKFSCYVQAAPISVYSIEGYGDNESPNTVVYIQSRTAGHDNEYDIWYRLKQPSARYRRFYEVFHWVATLGKHVIDFLESKPKGILVGLDSFRHDFHEWLIRRFPQDHRLIGWINAFGTTDFRRPVYAHIDYLGQEAHNLVNAKTLSRHTFWAGMRDSNFNIETQPIVCEKTVATPHTYLCFKRRYFAEFLEEVQPSDAVREATESRKQLLGFPTGSPGQASSFQFPPSPHRRDPSSLKVGDVIALLPDEEEERIWRKLAKERAVDKEWLAYVQRIERKPNREQRLFVIWLYRPEDTTISTTDYPVSQELFFSDNCNCNEAELLLTDISRNCTVEWFSKSFTTREDFLVRKKYITRESSFVDMKKDDLKCDCNRPKPTPVDGYERGDTAYILISEKGNEVLEPALIDNIDQAKREITARRFLRLKRDCSSISGNTRSDIAANELVWTNKLINVPFHRVRRKCYVRYFSESDVLTHNVPFPYNRGGAADYWVLSSVLIRQGEERFIIPLLNTPRTWKQGLDLRDTPIEKLPGLSLFTGCGSLDKGLEQGGTVEFQHAIDTSPEAIHTLQANASCPERLNLWLGSVDDYLKELLNGKKMHLIARIGDIAVIAAGSPCPGFSTLQQNWKSSKSLRNASHVTTFCSFVDLYRPKWAFLENVVNMACLRKGFEEERVLSQIIACLVSMGYQVQQFIMSSWNYASPQHRSRLILSIAAPGLVPITPPVYTHSFPDDFSPRSIGELLNGQKFGTQEECPTPFPYVTAGQAAAHLPNIGTGSVHGCIRFPDHRLYRPMNFRDRMIIKHIPTEPPGLGLAEAKKLRVVPPELYEGKKEIGRAYQRMKKDGLMPTIVTTPSAHDSRGGSVVHWVQNRPITIEEARIGQGIPHDEIILGSTSEQMRMIGNAVDRRVSEQLGLALRHAVQQSLRTVSHMNDISTGIQKLGFTSTIMSAPLHTQTPKASTSSCTQELNTFTRDTANTTSSKDQDDVQYISGHNKSLDPQTTGSIILVKVPKASLPPLREPVQAQRICGYSTISGLDPDIDPFGDAAFKTLADYPILSQREIRSSCLSSRRSGTISPDAQFRQPPLSTLPRLSDQAGRRYNESEGHKRLRDSNEKYSPSKKAKQTVHLESSAVSPPAIVPTALVSTVVEINRDTGFQTDLTGNRGSDLGSSPFKSLGSRKPRRSSLSLEFTPQAWSKVPEREIKKAKELAWKGSRPYA